jgi:hypothetical protein
VVRRRIAFYICAGNIVYRGVIVGQPVRLYKLIDDAESKNRLDDVGVTKVLEYGPILLCRKIAAMIGHREAIEE